MSILFKKISMKALDDMQKTLAKGEIVPWERENGY